MRSFHAIASAWLLAGLVLGASAETAAADARRPNPSTAHAEEALGAEEAALRQAVADATARSGPGSPAALEAMMRLAQFLKESGRAERALALMQDAAAVAENSLPRGARLRIMIALDLIVMENFIAPSTPGLVERLRALDVVATEALGEDDPLVGQVRGNLGIRLAIEDDVGSLDVLRSAIAVETAAGRGDSPLVIAMLQGMAIAYQDNNFYEEAEAMMRDVMARRGDDVSDSQRILHSYNLARTIEGQNRWPDALDAVRDSARLARLRAGTLRLSASGRTALIDTAPFRLQVAMAWLTSTGEFQFRP